MYSVTFWRSVGLPLSTETSASSSWPDAVVLGATTLMLTLLEEMVFSPPKKINAAAPRASKKNTTAPSKNLLKKELLFSVVENGISKFGLSPQSVGTFSSLSDALGWTGVRFSFGTTFSLREYSVRLSLSIELLSKSMKQIISYLK